LGVRSNLWAIDRLLTYIFAPLSNFDKPTDTSVYSSPSISTAQQRYCLYGLDIFGAFITATIDLELLADGTPSIWELQSSLPFNIQAC
jgi:hypothetical protein